jgi:phage shock protein PspC (stress-responsive transcriptional regulator)
VEDQGVSDTTTARRLDRRSDDRVLAGVARGLADHLGVEVLHVRIAFVVLAAAGGAGVVAYGLFWVFAPQDPYDTPRPRNRVRDLTMLLALG